MFRIMDIIIHVCIFEGANVIFIDNDYTDIKYQ
jgi:hypothetical protein